MHTPWFIQSPACMNYFMLSIFFKNYSHFIDNYISIFNIINEYIVTVAFDYTSYNNISANNDWSL